MGKLTYLLHVEHRPERKARVVLEGTTVHASHPERLRDLVRFENATEKEALETFQKIIRKYFHPNHGWRLTEKLPGVAELSDWHPPPAAAQPVRPRTAIRVEGSRMVIDLVRSPSADDIALALVPSNTAGVTALYIVSDPQPENPDACLIATTLQLIARGALETLRALHIDCPFEPVARVAPRRILHLVDALDALTQLERLHVVGDVAWPRAPKLPALVHASLLGDPLDKSAVDALAAIQAPALALLDLGLSHERAADRRTIAALPSLLSTHAHTVTLTGEYETDDVVDAFIATPVTGAALCTLRFVGERDAPEGGTAAAAARLRAWHPALADVSFTGTTSPFDPAEATDPEMRALIFGDAAKVSAT